MLLLLLSFCCVARDESSAVVIFWILRAGDSLTGSVELRLLVRDVGFGDSAATTAISPFFEELRRELRRDGVLTSGLLLFTLLFLEEALRVEDVACCEFEEGVGVELVLSVLSFWLLALLLLFFLLSCWPGLVFLPPAIHRITN